MARTVILLLFLPVVLLAGFCRENREDGENLSELTPEEFFARLEQAVTREGARFHAMMETVAVSEGKTQRLGHAEVWLDTGRRVSRGEWRKDPAWQADIGEQSTTIIVDGTSYISVPGEETRRSDTEQSEQCRAVKGLAPVNLTVLMGFFFCELSPVGVSPQVETEVEYEGRSAVALVYQKRLEGTGEGVGREDRASLYVSRETFLPLAAVIEYRTPAGELRGRTITSYDVEFVPVDSLPPDFFEPASIGYVEKDPAAALNDPDLGVTVYWLGRRFDPGSGLPPLVLDDALATTTPGSGPGSRAKIDYRGGVVLLLWRPEDWARFAQTPLGRLEWDSPCARTREIALPRGRAVIFMTYEPERRPPLATPVAVRPGETPPPWPTPTPVPFSALFPNGCPTGRDFDRFLAHVYFEDAVVTVNIPFCFACVGGFGPYDTLEGMEAVVTGLRPRAPGE